MASFDLNALSGINAASSGLAVISNNLANSQSVGFKASRAEFADMFSGPQNSPGSGVRVEAITQNFTQGTVSGTGRELDMAMNGEGFFVLEDQTGKYDNVYTRNGSFKLDKEGFMTDQTGNKVQGYLLNEALSTELEPVFSTALSSIDLDALNKIPKATSEMTYDINLDGQEINNVDSNKISVGDIPNNFDNLISPGYDSSNAYTGFPDYFYPMTIHDSLGGEHTLNANFYKNTVVEAFSSTTTTVTPGNELYDNTGTQLTDSSGNLLYYQVAGTDVTDYPIYDAAGAPVLDPPVTGAPLYAQSGQKYTSWLAQYTIAATDEQGNIKNTGTVETPVIPGGVEQGKVFELRFDTNGQFLGAYKPVATVDTPATPTTPATYNITYERDPAPTLDFIIADASGPLTGATDPLGGPIADPIGIALDFSDMSQFAGTYNQRGTTQNGYSIGDLVGLSTGLDGVIEARYSNGRSVPVAQLAVANFADKNAMEKLGGQTYAQSFASGAVQLGTPENNGFGSIVAGSLEYSNVDTAAELVNMIQTQRTYQASAQVISTSQELTRTILNL